MPASGRRKTGCHFVFAVLKDKWFNLSGRTVGDGVEKYPHRHNNVNLYVGKIGVFKFSG